MDHKIIATFLAFVLAIFATADGALKCYMCSSATDEACKDPVANNLEPIECKTENLQHWFNKIQSNAILSNIANLFEVDTPKHHQQAIQHMACAKMDVKVAQQEITLRSCQAAKTELIDPCKVIQGKIDSSFSSMEYCGLCDSDACNGSSMLSPKLIISILPLIGTFVLQAINHIA